jgi:hypothetical protein
MYMRHQQNMGKSCRWVNHNTYEADKQSLPKPKFKPKEKTKEKNELERKKEEAVVTWSLVCQKSKWWDANSPALLLFSFSFSLSFLYYIIIIIISS